MSPGGIDSTDFLGIMGKMKIILQERKGDMKEKTGKHSVDYSKRIVTIPNILTLFRLCLIPALVSLYVSAMRGEGDHLFFWAAGVLLLSFLTDVADGFIARTFHMISDLGKMLDPVADKLTQLAMLFCLVFRFFPIMMIPLVLLTVKELVSGVAVLLFMKETGTVAGADWHGKISTFLLYAMMLLHLIWYNIPPVISHSTILLCTAWMVMSFVLYMIRSLTPVFRSRREKNVPSDK